MKKGVIWTGSDDGLVYVTQDGGKHWENVTPKGLPEWMQINTIEASPFDAGDRLLRRNQIPVRRFSAVSLQNHRLRQDLGGHRQRHSRRAFTRVIREDPNHRNLLVAGTETGMYVSFNGGEKLAIVPAQPSQSFLSPIWRFRSARRNW